MFFMFSELLNHSIEFGIINNDPTFFSDFISLYKSGVSKEQFTYLINEELYEWYFGNLCHKIASIVQMKGITDKQIANITNTTFHLLMFDELRTNVRDYYDETPIDVLKSCANPSIKPLYVLLKYGKKIIEIQGLGCKQYLNNVTIKKKKAVRTIEKWWIEILCNPDSTIGKKMIQRKSDQWRLLYMMN